MRRLFAVILSLAFVINAHGQLYLIKNLAWQQKIKKNYFLAPLFDGVKRSNIQLQKEKNLTKELEDKYGNKDSAYKQLLINGWNYFTIGMIDSSIISFNQAYLLDNNNLETFFAFGSIIAFIDTKPNFELITHFKLNEKVSSTWDLTVFFGDPNFLDELRIIKKKQTIKPNLTSLLLNPKPPYFVDSAKYIMLKIKAGDAEGYYKMGRPNGIWIDYYSGTKKIMRTYNLVNGVESGQITGYYKNGNLSVIFYENNLGEIDGEYKVYDYDGQLARIEYWHKNHFDEKETKVIREWEEDGKITTEVVNGKFKNYVWKGGKKTLK